VADSNATTTFWFVPVVPGPPDRDSSGCPPRKNSWLTGQGPKPWGRGCRFHGRLSTGPRTAEGKANSHRMAIGKCRKKPHSIGTSGEIAIRNSHKVVKNDHSEAAVFRGGADGGDRAGAAIIKGRGRGLQDGIAYPTADHVRQPAMLCNSTSATPLSGALAIKNAVPSNVETVRWGGCGWGGRGWAGGAAGAVVGAAAAASARGGPHPPIPIGLVRESRFLLLCWQGQPAVSHATLQNSALAGTVADSARRRGFAIQPGFLRRKQSERRPVEL
jgi:hypothetical protein